MPPRLESEACGLVSPSAASLEMDGEVFEIIVLNCI